MHTAYTTIVQAALPWTGLISHETVSTMDSKWAMCAYMTLLPGFASKNRLRRICYPGPYFVLSDPSRSSIAILACSTVSG